MTAKDVFETYRAEINKHDFDLLVPLLAADCKFWFSSGTYTGLEQTRQAFEKTWNTIREEVYTLTEVEWINDSTCTYTYHWKGLVGGQPREGKGRGTSCFRTEHGAVKIAHEHLSPFPA